MWRAVGCERGERDEVRALEELADYVVERCGHRVEFLKPKGVARPPSWGVDAARHRDGCWRVDVHGGDTEAAGRMRGGRGRRARHARRWRRRRCSTAPTSGTVTVGAGAQEQAQPYPSEVRVQGGDGPIVDVNVS